MKVYILTDSPYHENTTLFSAHRSYRDALEAAKKRLPDIPLEVCKSYETWKYRIPGITALRSRPFPQDCDFKIVELELEETP